MFQHYLQLTLLAMFLCAVHQILITVVKLALLSVTAAAYVAVTTHQHLLYQQLFYDDR